MDLGHGMSDTVPIKGGYVIFCTSPMLLLRVAGLLAHPDVYHSVRF